MSYRDLVDAQQEFRQRQENQAREGIDLLRVRTDGAGQLVSGEAHLFQNPFVFQPDVMYGSELITPPDTDNYLLPRCTGTVMRWETNSRGFFVGAYFYLDVQCDTIAGQSPTAAPHAVVQHYFTFMGVSYKDLGGFADSELADPTLPPRDTEY